MAYVIIPRHDTVAALSALNRIYAEGELILEEQLDGTYKLKVGNGVQTYNLLAYIGGVGGGGSNAFGSIVVSGQSSIIADTISDAITIASGSGLTVTTNDTTDTLTISPLYGTTAGTICQGNDSRIGSGTPTAHATTHASGGSDPIKLDALAAPDDVTTRNATTSAHGLLPKLSGNALDVFIGTGVWGSPPTIGINVRSYGAVGNGTTDDTAAIQAAINAAQLTGDAVFFPVGEWRTVSTLTITARVTLYGVGASPYSADAHGVRGKGSWLYFDHGGIGISIGDPPSNIVGGVVLRDFGTRRNQPVSAPGWTPNDHGFEIKQFNTDLLIFNILMWNATRGIRLEQGNYGRLTVDNLRAHVFKVGIEIVECYDVPRLNNVHFWPFWVEDANIRAYTLNNLYGISIYRCDGLHLHNYFIINAFIGISIGQITQGTHLRGQYSNIYIDLSTYGILVQGTVTAQVMFQAVNVVISIDSAATGGTPLFIAGGNNSRIEISNLECCFCPARAVTVGGTGAVVSISQFRVSGWGWVTAGSSAFHVDTGNLLRFGNEPVLDNGQNGAIVKSGAGVATKPTLATI